jgi:lactoylglutathione lyase
MIKHLTTVTVYVENQDEALRFWTEQVGFVLREQRPMGPNAMWLEVAPPGADTALMLYPKTIMADWESRRPSVVFMTDDIEETCARLATNGVQFAKELAQMPWGKFASFLDTEGNEFGLRGLTSNARGPGDRVRVQVGALADSSVFLMIRRPRSMSSSTGGASSSGSTSVIHTNRIRPSSFETTCAAALW